MDNNKSDGGARAGGQKKNEPTTKKLLNLTLFLLTRLEEKFCLHLINGVMRPMFHYPETDGSFRGLSFSLSPGRLLGTGEGCAALSFRQCLFALVPRAARPLEMAEDVGFLVRFASLVGLM